MSSYYDDELSLYMRTIEMTDVTIISQVNCIIEHMMENFHFKNGRVYFNGMKDEKYVKSDNSNISVDVVSFINDLIQKNVLGTSGKVVYVGDNLTENGYEFSFKDLLKIVPYLVNEIPQHHYFLFDDATKLMYVSFENDICFVICN